MKSIFLILVSIILFFNLKSQNLNNKHWEFRTIDGFEMKSSMFNNKVIILTTFDANNIDLTYLRLLDSLQRIYYKKLIVIAIPVNDSGVVIATKKVLSVIRDSLKLTYPVSAISHLKTGLGQNAMWADASDSGTKIFDLTVVSSNQTLFIDSSGKAFSYLKQSDNITFNSLEYILGKQKSILAQ